jgi:hypothetical protein
MTLVGSDHDLDWEFAFDSRLGPATQWSVDSSVSALARASEATRRRHTTNAFGTGNSFLSKLV